MAQGTDWRAWCRARHMEPAASSVTCWFGDRADSRKHEVRVAELDEEFRLEATAVTKRHTTAMEGAGKDPQLDAWMRARVAKLVGFRVDGNGRLLVEATVPKAGLTSDEFRMYVQAVAVEADRLELVLTGRDEQ